MNGKAKSKQEILQEREQRKAEKARRQKKRAEESRKESARKWQEKQRNHRNYCQQSKKDREIAKTGTYQGMACTASNDRICEERAICSCGNRPKNNRSCACHGGARAMGQKANRDIRSDNHTSSRLRGEGRRSGIDSGSRIRPQRTRCNDREGDKVDGENHDSSRNGDDADWRVSPRISNRNRATRKNHQRTRDIQRAIREAKKRDGYKCRHCGESPVHGAHLLPRNLAVPEYDPANPDWIVTLCWKCHYVFDSGHTVKAKYKVAQSFGLTREAAMLKLLVYKGW